MQTKRSPFLTVASLSLLYPSLALSQQSGGPQQPSWDWPGPWHMHMWSGAWGFWWIFPLFVLFMLIACVAIFFLGHRSGSGHHQWRPWERMDRGHPWGDPAYSAMQILNERFAKGEIEKQEYEDKKAIILSSRQH